MLIKLICPHCGESLEIDSHEITHEISLENVTPVLTIFKMA